jgi:predicted nucleic acid-binding protein
MSDEPVFVDTNVLVYGLDPTAGIKHATARELIGRLWAEGTGCLSVQVLQELYVTLTRKVPRPIPEPVAGRLVDALCSWRIHTPTCRDVVAAIDLHHQHAVSFWDAMIVTAAAGLGCRRLLSEDLADGTSYGPIIVENPFRS